MKLKIGMKVYSPHNDAEGIIANIFGGFVVIQDKNGIYSVDELNNIFISAAELKPIIKVTNESKTIGPALLNIKLGDRVYDSSIEWDGLVWAWNEKSCVYLVDHAGYYKGGQKGELQASEWQSLEIRLDEVLTYELGGPCP